MIDALSHLNWLAVLAASVAHMVLGGIWFAALFKTPYAVALGIADRPQQTPGALFLVGPFVCSAVNIATSALFIRALGGCAPVRRHRRDRLPRRHGGQRRHQSALPPPVLLRGRLRALLRAGQPHVVPHHREPLVIGRRGAARGSGLASRRPRPPHAPR